MIRDWFLGFLWNFWQCALKCTFNAAGNQGFLNSSCFYFIPLECWLHWVSCVFWNSLDFVHLMVLNMRLCLLGDVKPSWYGWFPYRKLSLLHISLLYQVYHYSSIWGPDFQYIFRHIIPTVVSSSKTQFFFLTCASTSYKNIFITVPLVALCLALSLRSS